jgi:SAM-dependent methyltransferase
MPTLDWNSSIWDGTYNWPEAGEEWSEAWGGSESLWYGSILTRIGRYLPAPVVLEIAPGYGRWTRFLLKNCARLIGIDLSEACVNFCRKRFSEYPNAEFHANDGRSLSKVEDGSVDFVFSFDSLVHVEAEIIEAYVLQIAHKLNPQGIGFIHHSNLGACAPDTPNGHMRARSMTADKFLQFCDSAGLVCISREIINWGQPEVIDCLSMFTPANSIWARLSCRLENPRFMLEAEMLKAISPLYHPPTTRSRG